MYICPHVVFQTPWPSPPTLPYPTLRSRAAFTSILESVRSVPFPIPRAFFRTGGEPRVSLSLLPPPPAALIQQEFASDASSNGGSQAFGPTSLNQQQGQRERAASPAPPSNDAESIVGGDTGSKRPRRDGGASAGYYGPSCGLRADIAVGERSRRPPLPLMAVGVEAGEGTEKGRFGSCLVSFSAAETWWAQFARDEAMSGGNGWRWQAHAQAQVLGTTPGVWLLQGSVCRGRGAGGALPPVSKVRVPEKTFQQDGRKLLCMWYRCLTLLCFALCVPLLFLTFYTLHDCDFTSL